MKFRLKLLVMCFCFVLISPALAATLPSTVPEAVGFSSERLSRIDAVLMADILLAREKSHTLKILACGTRKPACRWKKIPYSVFIP